MTQPGVALATILSDDFDFSLLTEEEAAEYIRQLEAVVGDIWSLTPRQLFAEAMGETVDWMLAGGAAGAGKALALDTPIATTDGWRTIGTLRQGDLVFNEHGQTTAVLQVHPALVAQAHVVWFGGPDDESIVANGDHRWWVRVDDEDGPGRIVTTTEMSELLAARKRVEIPPSPGQEKPWRVRDVYRSSLALMRCITVDNPTGIFLAGDDFIPTHNSELACFHANKLSLQVPGHTSLLLRRSIPELRRSLIIRLIARIGRYKIPAKYRKLDGQSGFQYRNGSLIECGHMQTEESIAKYLGSEYDLIVVDESTTLTEQQIVQVQSRLRTTKEKARAGARPHLWLLTNPGGISHAWHYDLFITPCEYGQKIVTYDISQGMDKRFVVAEYEAPIPNVAEATDVEVVEVLLPWVRSLPIEPHPDRLTVGFVPARATHNPHIDPTYLRSLNTLDERRRRQLRDGDWDTFEGMYFESFRRATHVIQPFPIPPTWQRARGIDFGSTNPYCCLWGAWDEDGNCYIYREDYVAGITPQEQARRVVERSTMDVDGLTRPERFMATVADPSVFSNHRGAGKTIADMWRDAGLSVTRAKNQRVAGWTNVRQYLWDYEREAPRLFIFDTCTNLVRTFPLAQHDNNNAEDMDTHGDDHALDSARYLLAVRPISAQHRAERKPTTMDERFAAKLRKLDRRRR